MRSSWLVFFVCVLGLFAMGSCTDDSNVGSSILSPDDEIVVKSDTFGVYSSLGACAAMNMTPDSFLLGECDTHFGTIKADILTQLACPEGFAYPDTLVMAGVPIATVLEVDSVCLYLHYRNCYGDGQSPLGITIHELDRQGLKDNQKYESDLSLSDYCSLDQSTMIVENSAIIVPAAPSDSAYSTEMEAYIPTIRIKLSDAFAQRFFRIKSFPSQEQFNNEFKGLYISTDFGGSNVLYINDISMTVFYRIKVADTTLYDAKSFYVNEEVRQVNRYVYPNREQVLGQLSEVSDTNFIVSPANIYTRLSIRMDSILDKINHGLDGADAYRVYVNRANLKVDVLYSDSATSRPRDTWSSPASYMMLIKESHLDEFLSKNVAPADSVAIVASLSLDVDSMSNVSYSYIYDLSSLLTSQLRKGADVEEVQFALLPVAVETNSSTGKISSVKQQQTISATYIRSASNTIDPMNIEVVYSGFSLTR